MQTANGFSISQVTILTTIKPGIPKLQGNLGELATKYKKARDYAVLPKSTLKFYFLHMNEFRPTYLFSLNVWLTEWLNANWVRHKYVSDTSWDLHRSWHASDCVSASKLTSMRLILIQETLIRHFMQWALCNWHEYTFCRAVWLVIDKHCSTAKGNRCILCFTGTKAYWFR